MQQRRTQQVRVVMPGAQQALGDVEAMAPIRHGHRLEQSQPAVGKRASDERDLSRVDARADVRDELPDPMHR
jgi:hypothetical protein